MDTKSLDERIRAKAEKELDAELKAWREKMYEMMGGRKMHTVCDVASKLEGNDDIRFGEVLLAVCAIAKEQTLPGRADVAVEDFIHKFDELQLDVEELQEAEAGRHD